MQYNPAGKLAMLVGGGPAPGINGVISSVTIEAINNGIETIGLRDGFKYLVRGQPELVPLTIDTVKAYYQRGGSLLGTSRTNPAKSPADMANVLATLGRLEVDALVTIGGDDTAFSASEVWRQAGGGIRVAHVPK